MLKIVQASLQNVEELVPLFDQYRLFYKQESDLQGAKVFLTNRLNNNESVVFLAYFKDIPVGFTQLYPMFSSVSMQQSFVLNDLFVAAPYRKLQIGEALLNKAKAFCIAKKAKGLSLETGIDNPAQKLYERLDWVKDIDCFHYFWTAQ
jgi:GNAT superfamily N-acetyltransferase